MFRLNFSVVLQKRTQLMFILLIGLLFLLCFSINVNVFLCPGKPLWIAWCLMSSIKICPCLSLPSTGEMEEQQPPAVDDLDRTEREFKMNITDESKETVWYLQYLMTPLEKSLCPLSLHRLCHTLLSSLWKRMKSHVYVGQSKNQ